MFWGALNGNGRILPEKFFEAADVEFEGSRIWLFLAAIEFFNKTGGNLEKFFGTFRTVYSFFMLNGSREFKCLTS